MALRKRINKIDISQIKAGQVLEIDYTDSGRVMIFVIDPKVVTKTNSQSRPGNLFAFKLKNLTEKEAFDMIKMARNESRNNKNMYDVIKTSKYVEGGEKSLRSYKPEKIKRVSRVTLGHPTDVPTKKIQIGNSVLYGVSHGNYVFVHENDWDDLENELLSKNATFFEGTAGHEKPVEELISYLIGKTTDTSDSWEPSDDVFGDAELIGKLVSGWWNQTIADGQGLSNLINAWRKSGVAFNETIGNAFKASVGSSYQLILDNFQGYEENGRYSKEAFIDTLNKRGFADDKGKQYTEDLVDFNEAGHDQVFPEDQEPPLPPGPIKNSEAAFNRTRDLHLIEMMKTTPGIYFAGDGHVDNLRNMGYGR
jgi:hypothetical protein